MSNSPGKNIIADYELGHVINHGRHSKVYSAVDSTSGEAVAVKELDWKNIPLHERAEIRREVAAMLCLNHPNIVRMHDVIATSKYIYLIMEFIDGQDLARVLKNGGGKVGEDVARKLFRQLISAVGHFHGKGLVHRNLKLQNLFVDGQGNLKISGFGLCAFVPGDEGEGIGLQSNVGGGLEYAAPEMLLARGGYDGKKADVWSCGVILYVMLTGKFPFETTNLGAFLRRISRAEFERPVWFSSELEWLFQMLLEPKPRFRVCIPGLMRYPWISRGLEEREPPLKLEDREPPLKQEKGMKEVPGRREG